MGDDSPMDQTRMLADRLRRKFSQQVVLAAAGGLALAGLVAASARDSVGVVFGLVVGAGPALAFILVKRKLLTGVLRFLENAGTAPDAKVIGSTGAAALVCASGVLLERGAHVLTFERESQLGERSRLLSGSYDESSQAVVLLGSRRFKGRSPIKNPAGVEQEFSEKFSVPLARETSPDEGHALAKQITIAAGKWSD